MDEWISIKDRLPNPNTRVIVKNNENKTRTGWYKPNFYDDDFYKNFNTYWILDDDGFENIIMSIDYWMELPAKPNN